MVVVAVAVVEEGFLKVERRCIGDAPVCVGSLSLGSVVGGSVEVFLGGVGVGEFMGS